MTSRVWALAKVNLGLYVLYRRPDHFHEIRTVYQTISLADELEIEYRRGKGPAVELECDRPELSGGDNLAAQAARRLLEASGDRGRVRIWLGKRIPVGAGLGGGSSDAAAVLLTLAARLHPRPDQELLLRLAAELGSDVPFFLHGGRAVGVGRGTEIYPLPDLPRRWMLVVAPSAPVATAEAYRRLSPHLTSAAAEDKIYRLGSSTFEAALENDFERIVFQMHPELQTLKARLVALGARSALLCGSGSALFGVFRDRHEAVRARDSDELAEVSRFVASTVSRAAYRARWRYWME